MKKEVKVGIVVLVAIGVFIYGFNFLQGNNLFNPQRKLYAVYSKVDGLLEANPLLLNGYKVGQVNKIELREQNGKYDVRVTFFLSSDVEIPDSSIARIVSSDLLGSKAVNLVFSDKKTFVENGAYLKGESEEGLQATVDKRIAPLQKKAEALISSIDSVMQVVTQVMNADVRRNLITSFESIKNTISTLEHTTYKVDTLLSSQQYAIANIIQKVNSITSNVEQNNAQLTNVIHNFSDISDSLAAADLKKTIEQTNQALLQANEMLAQINSGKGSMGKMIKNDSLYDNLNRSAESLDKLVRDLRYNPERYVHISVFGRKDRNKQKIIDEDKKKK